MTESLSRRLDRLQERFTSGCDNCTVTITYKSGNIVIIPYYPDFTGYFDDDGTFHESEVERRGWAGEIASLACDNWRYEGMIALAAALWGCEYIQP